MNLCIYCLSYRRVMSTGSSSGNHDPRHGSWTVSIEMPSPTALQLATSNNMNNISATSEFDSNALVQNHQRRGKGLRAPICLKLTIFVGLLVNVQFRVIHLLLRCHMIVKIKHADRKF